MNKLELPKNPYPKNTAMFLPYKWGCKDTLKAVIKWLYEICVDDSHSSGYWLKDSSEIHREPRRCCDKCIQELNASISQ